MQQRSQNCALYAANHDESFYCECLSTQISVVFSFRKKENPKDFPFPRFSFVVTNNCAFIDSGLPDHTT